MYVRKTKTLFCTSALFRKQKCKLQLITQKGPSFVACFAIPN